MSKLIVQSLTPKVGNIITLESGHTISGLPPTAVIQANTVRSDTLTTYAGATSGNGTTISLMNVSITPTSTESMLYMKWMLNAETQQDLVFLIHRNGNLITDVGYEGYNADTGNQRYSGIVSGWYDNNNDSTGSNFCIHHFVKANTTETVTFSPAVRSSYGTAVSFVMNTNFGGTSGAREKAVCIGTIMEFGADSYTYSLT